MIKEIIKFSIIGETGIIKLNRPNSLNALNYDMVLVFLDKLLEWEKDKKINRVLLYSEGKSFCVGGDIKSLLLSSEKDKLKEFFFKKEYALNNTINRFSKDYLSIWNGIVMGGGVGLSIYGNYRLVTENTRFAMPETAIGFFPDVGGSFFLSRLGKGIGLYLGLTGKICTASDLMNLGLATHYVPSKYIKKTINEYVENGNINNSYELPNISSDISDNHNFIEDVFQGSIKEIIIKLKKSKNEFGQKIYSHLLTRCPMSLAITEKLLNLGKSKTLTQCLDIEYQLSQYMVYRSDFDNGVNSVLVNKTDKVDWNPANIDEINFIKLDKMFEGFEKNNNTVLW